MSGGAPAELENTALEVNVWTAVPGRVLSRERSAELLRILDQDEKRTYRSLCSQDDKGTYLVAHALLRTLLSRYSDAPPETWRFGRGAHGRPLVLGPSPLYFSLTHAAGLVGCVVSTDSEVGIDAERCDHDFNPLSLAPWVLASSEVQQLASLDKQEKLARFISLWVMKEAAAKAKGLGLMAPLRHWTFERIGAEQFGLQEPDRAAPPRTEWRCIVKAPTPIHHLAVCIRCKRSRAVRVRLGEADWLLG